MESERREYRRVKCGLPVRYSLVSGDFVGSGGSTLANISMGGLAFFIDYPVDFYDILDIEISLPKSAPVRTRGKVTHITKVDNAYLLGVRFLNIGYEDAEAIKNYISKLP